MTPVDLANDHEYVWMAGPKCVGCEAHRGKLATHVRGVLISALAARIAQRLLRLRVRTDRSVKHFLRTK